MNFDREIIETFLLEADESVLIAEDTVIALESRPDDPELMQGLFRAIHNVKGSAGSLGFDQMALVAHALEDLLDGLRRGTLQVDASLITLVLESLDRMRAAAEAVRATGKDEASASPDFIQRLQEASLRQRPDPGAQDSPSLQPVAGQQSIPGSVRRGRTLRVDIEKLDLALDTMGEMSVALGQLDSLLTPTARGLPEEAFEVHQRLLRLHSCLQDRMMSLRMVPIGPMLRGFIRTLRDVSGVQGKQARLVIEGGEVTIDANVIEAMREPLTHLVRNAVGHGIELPADRKRRGKDPCGRITIRTRRDAGSVIVQIEDDGAGLSRSRIAECARSLGLIKKEGQQPLVKISDAELFALVFLPGFSTAERVTELSGRGVGMDAVKRAVDSLHGTVEIAGLEGIGTTVTIRLPVSLSLLDGFSVGLGEDVFLLPREAVRECLALPAALGDRGVSVLQVRGQALPIVRLRELLDETAASSKPESLVVLDCGGMQLGLAVETLHGETRAMVKPMSAIFKNVRTVTGCVVLGNGRIALVLDVAGLVQAALRLRANRPVNAGPELGAS